MEDVATAWGGVTQGFGPVQTHTDSDWILWSPVWRHSAHPEHTLIFLLRSFNPNPQRSHHHAAHAVSKAEHTSHQKRACQTAARNPTRKEDCPQHTDKHRSWQGRETEATLHSRGGGDGGHLWRSAWWVLRWLVMKRHESGRLACLLRGIHQSTAAAHVAQAPSQL